MKIAVCISGHLRNIESGHQNFIDKVVTPNSSASFDFFIDTWDNLDWRTKDCFKETATIVSKIKSLYNPVDLNIEKFINWDTSKYVKFIKNERWVKKGLGGKRSSGEHILGMYYKILQCNNLKKKYEENMSLTYDLVIRTRSDIGFSSPIYFSNLKDKETTVYVPNCTDEAKKSGIPIRDVFAVSSSKNMNYYSSVFENLDKILKSTLEFRPEPILHSHLMSNSQLTIRELDCGWHLI